MKYEDFYQFSEEVGQYRKVYNGTKNEIGNLQAKVKSIESKIKDLEKEKRDLKRNFKGKDLEIQNRKNDRLIKDREEEKNKIEEELKKTKKKLDDERVNAYEAIHARVEVKKEKIEINENNIEVLKKQMLKVEENITRIESDNSMTPAIKEAMLLGLKQQESDYDKMMEEFVLTSETLLDEKLELENLEKSIAVDSTKADKFFEEYDKIGIPNVWKNHEFEPVTPTTPSSTPTSASTPTVPSSTPTSASAPTVPSSTPTRASAPTVPSSTPTTPGSIFDLGYNEEILKQVCRKYGEIIPKIARDKDARKVIELNNKDTQLLNEMIDFALDKAKRFKSFLSRTDLEQDRKEAIKTEYEEFKSLDLNKLVKEMIAKQKMLVETCDEKDITKNREKFNDMRHAASRLGIISSTEYENLKLNSDIIKPISGLVISKHEGDKIEINIGKGVSIKYGKDKFKIKNLKGAEKYDRIDAMRNLRENFKLVDGMAVKMCFDKNTIDPLIIYSVLNAKDIEPSEQFEILEKYLRDGLDAAQDMKIEKHLGVIYDLKGISKSKLPPEKKKECVIKSKMLSRSNLAEVRGEYKIGTWSRIKQFLGIEKRVKIPEISTASAPTEKEYDAAMAYNKTRDEGKTDNIKDNEFLENLHFDVQHTTDNKTVSRTDKDQTLSEESKKEITELDELMR